MSRLKITRCRNCLKKFKQLEYRYKIFCSRSCVTIYRNKHSNPMWNACAREKMIMKKVGCLVWNKGLTKNEHPSIMKHSENLRVNNPMFDKKIKNKAIKNIRRYFENETEQHRKERSEKGKNWFNKHPERRKEISKTIKKANKDGKMWWQSADENYKKVIGKKLSKIQSEWIKNNPEKVKKRAEKRAMYYEQYPERHPLRKMSHKISFWQRRLYLLLCCFIDKKELEEEFFIKTYKSYRIADIAWVKNKIDFEYDGYRHSKKDDKANDIRRDRQLKSIGWRTYRFTFNDFETGSFENKIIKILKNEI